MQKINYNLLMEKEIKKFENSTNSPSLLLHSCCAPCSSSAMEFLANIFKITVYFYNPNITLEEEYITRRDEQIEFIKVLNKKVKYPIKFVEGNYNTQDFFSYIEGLEDIKEGGKRCFKCYNLRLEETAKFSKKFNFDYFTTALTISPMKNSNVINKLGEHLGTKYDTTFLNSDFKKKNRFKRSIEISKEHNLYRQDFCGCIFSKKEREEIKKKKINSQQEDI